jgi:hypothetical protein
MGTKRSMGRWLTLIRQVLRPNLYMDNLDVKGSARSSQAIAQSGHHEGPEEG